MAGYAAGSADTPAEPNSAEALKAEGNNLYVQGNNLEAIEKYGLAIKAFVATLGDEPEAPADRKALAILYSNRAQAFLAHVKTATQGQVKPGEALPKEIRQQVMRANADASQAVELDENNAKAWLRKGQAQLSMSVLQQRAKEAVACIEKGIRLGLPSSMKPEAEKWLNYGKATFDNETPMPDNCALM